MGACIEQGNHNTRAISRCRKKLLNETHCIAYAPSQCALEGAIQTHIVVFVLTTSKKDEDVISSYEKHIAGYFVKDEAGMAFQNTVKLLEGYWKIIYLPAKHQT